MSCCSQYGTSKNPRNPNSYAQYVTPFYGQQGGMKRQVSGIPAYDKCAISFRDGVERYRFYDMANMVPGFVDFAGNNAIASFEQFQHPPEYLFQPSNFWPCGKSACGGGYTGLKAWSEEYDQCEAALSCQSGQCRSFGKCMPDGSCACVPGTSGQFCQNPGPAPRRLNQLLHGMTT